MIHSNLVIADSIESSDLAPELKIESLDVKHIIVSSLGIDDARNLVSLSNAKAFLSRNRYFVIEANNLTNEAQNALLKLFEEPPNGTIFFLVIPNISILLPTLQSRLMLTGKIDSTIKNESKAFLKMNYKERLDFIDKATKNNPELIKQMINDIAILKSKEKSLKHSLLLASKYIKNRGSSRKMLMEELALTLPIDTSERKM